MVAAGASASGQEWIEIWSDEFDYTGAVDPQKWVYDLGNGEFGWGNQEKQFYTDDLANVSAEDGKLVIRVTQDRSGRSPIYFSGRIKTEERFEFQYGRVEVRAKLPSEVGTWAAIWMLSSDRIVGSGIWPDTGEIDIVETVGYEIDQAFLQEINEPFLENVHATVHTKIFNFLQGQGGIGNSIYEPTASTEFHVYALEWFPDRLVFYFDDTVVMELNKETDVGIPGRNRPPDDQLWPYWPFDQRFHLILNVAVGGVWGGHYNSGGDYINAGPGYPSSPYGPDGIDTDGDWPQTMEVDYVRVYQQPWMMDRATATPLPGRIDPRNSVEDFGLLWKRSTSPHLDLHLRNIDEGDYAVYDVVAAEPGAYPLVAEVTSLGGGETFLIENLTTGESLTTAALPSTGADTLQEFLLGNVVLQRGPNRLRLTAEDAGAELGSMRLATAATGTWGGWEVDALGAIDTAAWLGPIGTSAAPWLYVPRANAWLAPYSAILEQDLKVESQWMYAHDPSSLGVIGEFASPWFYSDELSKWFYAWGVAQGGELADSQWIFLITPNIIDN